MERLGYVMRVQRPENRRMVFIHLTPKGRLLKSKLVPLAEEVNGIGIRGIKAADVAVTRRTLLAILDNLAVDELQSSSPQRRVPITARAIAHRAGTEKPGWCLNAAAAPRSIRRNVRRRRFARSLAEGVGFEPTRELPLWRFSRPLP